MTAHDTAIAATNPVLSGIAPFLVGVVIVAVLIAAVWLGIRVRNRESAPPRPEEQPRPPASGPVREASESREPDEVPRGDTRLTPHESPGFGNVGGKRGGDQRRRRWSGGSSGGFGSGGHGSKP
ncbi:DUF6479 family protein [Streptomyces jeddahensis]|uniref:Secreted protein n=1 Tax=Streptomyces jeddahensis TaxID=1716141 RepID=A0A177HZW5_9ACTN|nr:DUF6479 family protein [Streptomyces jeddahensis]OAH16336.1 hypothetical protein STSP_02990 [Streptomyces jeddahensis]